MGNTQIVSGGRIITNFIVMNEIIRIDTITELLQFMGLDKPTHPLIAIVDFSKINKQSFEQEVRFSTGFYSVMLKNQCLGQMKYGRKTYDFQEGTLFFMGPEQVVSIGENEESSEETVGWGLFFHPDLIRKSNLIKQMKDYTFFNYEADEALHLSDKEKQNLKDCVQKIEVELSQHIDNHSQTLIISNIELLLNYCTRYYQRQFITRVNHNKDEVVKFEEFLKAYFDSDQARISGLPSVKFCAEQMNFSPNYLSDLLKKETGKNTQEHIHYYIIEQAKTQLLITNDSVSEIAYDLGFEYPQYFSKIFKNKVGVSPAEFRSAN